jgi:thioredoxin reductase (NADPH)
MVGPAMATNLDRVYAAGDITEYPGKVRLIAVGFGEAATAVNNAVAALDPAAPLFPGHSSDLAAVPASPAPSALPVSPARTA